MDFGAAGDAVIGDQSNDTDDTPAFRLAVDAAIAAGHKTVYVPCGNYRLGTSGSIVSGLRLVDGDDGLHIFGDGDCSVLMPASWQGQIIIRFCHDASCSGQEETGPDDVLIENLKLLDDDPIGHGHAHSYVATISDLTGTFHFHEQLTFTGGATASFHSIRPDGSMWYMDDRVGTLLLGTVVGENGASAQVLSYKVPTLEESHGIYQDVGQRLTIRHTTFESIGDESIVLSKRSSGARILNNTFVDCPSVPSAGSCVNREHPGGRGHRDRLQHL